MTLKNFLLVILSALIFGCATTNTQKEQERQMLFEAIRDKNLSQVQVIVERGVVDLDPPTQPNMVNKALAYASIYGNLDIVEYILSQGVEIDGIVSYRGTALLRASEARNFDIATFLIKSGANVNHANSFGISVMSGYAIVCKPELIDLALEYGGDINMSHVMTVSTNYGEQAYNPIQWAVLKGNIECVEHLINKGADLNVVSRDNETLIDLANRQENQEIIRLIEDNS